MGYLENDLISMASQKMSDLPFLLLGQIQIGDIGTYTIFIYIYTSLKTCLIIIPNNAFHIGKPR